jgi:hypothetical protein
MPEPKSFSGFTPDISKLSFYGDESGQKDYVEPTSKLLDDLEKRYAQPNWLKVSAGFLKPQLGGFGASLGSAFGELGNTQQQSLEAALPIAQARAQLAVFENQANQKKTATRRLEEWKKTARPGDLPPPDLVLELASRNPEVGKVASDVVTQQQAQRTISQKEQAQQIEILKAKQVALDNLRKNGQISFEDFTAQNSSIMSQLSSLASASPYVNPSSRSNVVDGATVNQPNPSGATVPAATPATPAGNGSSAPRANPPANAPSSTSEANQTDLTNYRLTPTFTTTMLHPNPMTEDEKYRNESIRTEAANLEKAPREQWAILQKQMASTPFNTALKANQSGLEMIDKEPNTVAEISEILRRKGPTAELLSKGIGISIGPLGANISIKGIEPALIADLPKEKRDAYDKLLNALAKSTYYDLVSRGIDPEKEGAAKFGQMMLQEAGMAQGAAAIHRTFAENNERLMHNKRVHDAAKVILPKMNSSKSLTPYYDFYNNHPEVKVLDKMLQNRLSKIQ